MSKYKLVEKKRYNERAKKNLDTINDGNSLSLGYQSLPLHLQAPYKFYQESISSRTFKGVRILDMCCGDGLHSFTGARNGADLTITDIAEFNVKVALDKAKLLGLCVEGVVGDMDELKFENDAFELVTCAGSLSYLNLEKVIPKVNQILKQEGCLIIVDSFNHNPIYKFNRFIHFLKGNRTYRVNQNIPSEKTLKYISKYFSKVEVKYFGIFTFAVFVLRPFFSKQKMANILDKLDIYFSFLKKYAFKIVIIAKK